MSDMLVFHNGRLVARESAVLPIHDAGIVSGVIVTDFCRTFGRCLFRWEAHLARLRRDGSACFIDLPYSDTDLTAAAQDLVAHNGSLLPAESELALVTFATPGPIGLYAGQPGVDGPPSVVMHTFELPLERYRRFFSEGVVLAVAGRHGAGGDDLAPPAVKHRSRLHWWRGERLLRQRGDVPPGAVALLLDANGAITETAIGHVLFVRGGTVLAPPPGTVLDGISLGVVRELCGQLGVPFAESRLTLDDVPDTTEAMLVGSAFCLAGVRQIEGVTLPWRGPLTRRLLAAWSRMVGLDIAGQFLRAVGD